MVRLRDAVWTVWKDVRAVGSELCQQCETDSP